jgi:hypothetical protein
MNAQLLATIVSVTVMSQSLAADPKPPRSGRPRPEHEFLKRFVGEWECATETFFRPGKSETTKGTMTGHMIGDFWVVIDRKADMRGSAYHGRATYGFDLRKKKYVGTWTDSMAPILWHYEGETDGESLAVETEGPHPFLKGNHRFRNTWEFKTDDEVVLTSEMEGSDGKMITILKSTCRRKKPKQ